MIDDEYQLDDLFTIRDYRSVTITIPNNSSILSINLLHSPAACTDHDLTGQVLWPVSRLLSHYLASDQINLLGKSVLELGAGGTALPSITALMCGATKVLATDGNDGVVLDLLQQNIQNQQQVILTQRQTKLSTLPTLSCQQLLWGNCDHVQSIRNESNNRRPFNVIIAADVVQWPAVLEPLLHTVHAFMWNDTNINKQFDKNDHQSVFILGIVERSFTIYQQFLTLSHSMGFDCRQIDSKEYLEDGIVPISCREYGGRTTKLLELSLRSDYIERPLLLSQQCQDQDYTVGQSYKHTSFFPC
jgi:Lysine methyltransferase